MKGYSSWSHTPYRPLLTEVGDIYICRIAPAKHSILMEWLDVKETCTVYYRLRNEESFRCAGSTSATRFEITGLEEGEEYEIYVAAGSKKSRVRLARTAEPIGTVITYLHPEDNAYAFSGNYLASPSLLVHPGGYLLASMDVFCQETPQNLTLIYRSDDGGESWHYVSELMPCFWGKLFLHKGEVYMLSVSTEYGDLLISKSNDGGMSFPAPVVLMRGANGKRCKPGFHKNPQNILIHNGRLYETLEWGSWGNESGYKHAAMVMSIDVNDDLLVPENWTFSAPLKFDIFAPELEGLTSEAMTIEGTLTVAPDGRLLNVMRFEKHGYVLAYEVVSPEELRYSHLIEMPTNHSKFMIKYDTVSKKYYSVVCQKYEGCFSAARNLVSLLSSEDLAHWEIATPLIDKRDEDAHAVGFQYMDFSFSGEDLLFLCRTARNGAKNFHDSNQITFHRVKNFRNL